jgi:predicted glycosyltransferase
MKIAIFINTPAQVHFFKNIIKELEGKGHNIKILARNYGETLYLSNTFNIPHFVYAGISKSKYRKIILLPYHIFSAHRYLKKIGIDLVVGTGIYSVYASFLLKKPNIIFIDAVSTKTELNWIKPFTNAIITPSNLATDLGNRHIRINSFKELSYLHPNYFGPDKTVLNQLSLDEKDNFALLRLNAFDSTHDFGVSGFTLNECRILIKELKKYGKVFISSETPIPEDLRDYILRIPKEKIHDILYYAKILIADTGTMVTEAALLGTPAICHYPKAKKIGNFIELEERYGLIFNVQNFNEIIGKTMDLLARRDLKKEWKEKRDRVIKEKIDITRFMVWFIENFPESITTMKEKPSFQEIFA